MGRKLTDEEMREFEAKRRESLRATASRLGIPVEELERREQEARAGASTPAAQTERNRAAATMRAALDAVGTGLIDSLKTDTQRKALDTVRGLESMSDDEFAALLAERMMMLDEEERQEAKKAINQKIERWDGGDTAISLREEILLELQAMIRRHEYYAGQGR